MLWSTLPKSTAIGFLKMFWQGSLPRKTLLMNHLWIRIKGLVYSQGMMWQDWNCNEVMFFFFKQLKIIDWKYLPEIDYRLTRSDCRSSVKCPNAIKYISKDNSRYFLQTSLMSGQLPSCASSGNPSICLKLDAEVHHPMKTNNIHSWQRVNIIRSE